MISPSFLSQLLVRAACLAALLSVSACGGGGAGGGPIETYMPYEQLANLCANPQGNEKQGTLAQEKDFLRSFTNETYLWYSEVPTNLVAANYPTAQDYFGVLKTPAITASGKAKDQFHFYYPTNDWNNAQNGISSDYGIRWIFGSTTPPRKLTVAFVEPGSPAGLAGVQRGDEVSTVDGVSLVNDNTSSGIATLNQGVLASDNATHTFTFNGTTTPINLTPAIYTTATVQNVKAISSNGRTVGYLTFNSHLEKSVDELKTAIQTLKAANVTDLVLDMRYNGGGLLETASRLAYMIAGPTLTNGKTFENAVVNDKLLKTLTSADLNTPFYSQAADKSALPYLGLRQVTVLSTYSTASASESVINGLRGVGVTVNVVGATTRGKPYGFVPQGNCGYTYFTIQFQGVNQLGFGDYADGFPPNCEASDDLKHAMGDTNETMLSSALIYMNTGKCPSASSNPLGGISRVASTAPQQVLNPTFTAMKFRAH